MKPGLEGRTKQNLFSLAAVVCHLSELFHFGKLNINFMIPVCITFPRNEKL